MTSYYREGSKRAEGVRYLFTKIARHYDCINDLQSVGMHRVWKRRLVSALQIRSKDWVLDLACGSGDLVFRALNSQSQAHIVGGDFTLPMLKVARNRSQRHRLLPQGWVNLDALSLPFPKKVFDVVMMAYGLRNIADPLAALHEISRVLKVGGRVAILDFGKPTNPLLRPLYYAFLRTVQPTLGWLFFRDHNTYRYIYESLMRYPAQEGVTHLLQEASFSSIKCMNLTGGIMSLHLASKAI